MAANQQAEDVVVEVENNADEGNTNQQLIEGAEDDNVARNNERNSPARGGGKEQVITHSVLAVRLTDFGDYDKLKVEKVEIPLIPPEGHVEVRVHACGVNFADLYTRQGLMRDRKPPFTLGMECTGEIVAVAKDIKTFKIGDHVACYRYEGGLHQESVVISESSCFLLPNDIPYDDGVALIVNYLTAYFCVIDIGNLQPGQSMLVHSCAGGVGWAATQLAHTIRDITVYGTCSSENKHQVVKQNGVNYVFNYQNYENELKAKSPDGVHLVIDSIGGANFTVSQRILKPVGRAVLTGASSMINSTRRLSFLDLICIWWRTKNIEPTDLIMRSRVVSGFHLANVLKDDPQRVRAAMTEIFLLYKEGKLKPRIDSIWPFEKVVDAMKVLQEKRNIGKVILKPVIK